MEGGRVELHLTAEDELLRLGVQLDLVRRHLHGRDVPARATSLEQEAERYERNDSDARARAHEAFAGEASVTRNSRPARTVRGNRSGLWRPGDRRRRSPASTAPRPCGRPRWGRW